jgi:hypothetical protein
VTLRIILVFRYFLGTVKKNTKILKHFLCLPTFELLTVFKATAKESAIIIIMMMIIIIIIIIAQQL